MKKYDLYIFFLGLITGIFLTVIIAICYNNYYNQEVQTSPSLKNQKILSP